MTTFDAVRGFDRPVYAVSAGQFVNVFGRGLVYPFATVYFHLAVGIPLAVVGVGLLANNLATAGGTAAGGYLADRRGRKPVMVASMALSALTLAAYALVTTGRGFVAVSTAAGLTVGLYPPAGQAMIADLASGDDLDDAFALLKTARNAGFGLGFVAGGLLYAVAHTAVFVADGLTSGLFALVVAFLLPRVHEGSRDAAFADAVGDWGRAVTRPRIVALGLLNVGFAVMYAQMGATVPVVATEDLGLTSTQLGTLYVLNPLIIVLFQVPIVARIDGWRRTRGLVLSAGFWGAGFVAVALATGAPVLAGVVLIGAFLVVRTVGEVLHAPLITSLGSEFAPTSDRGAQLSLLEIAKRLGMGLGAFVGGWFFDAGLQRLLWPILVATCAGLAVGSFALERHVSATENRRRNG